VSAGVFSALDLGRLVPGDSPWRHVPYAAFAFLGLVFWTHFAQSLIGGTSSLVAARDMLHKSKFPAGLIPTSRTAAWLPDLSIGFAVLLVLMLAGGMRLEATAALVPVVFILQFVFTVGLALLLSTLNLFFRDVSFVVQVGLPALMFASDVVLPIEGATGTARKVLSLNPMASYLDAYRRLMFLGELPTAASLAPGLVGAAVALLTGVLCFRRFSHRFAEEV
jgi:ABC-type polysaccharide/polyol phosphate export permease